MMKKMKKIFCYWCSNGSLQQLDQQYGAWLRANSDRLQKPQSVKVHVMTLGDDDNTKEKWTVHSSSTDKGQKGGKPHHGNGGDGSGTYHSCKKREYAFMIFREYLIIFWIFTWRPMVDKEARFTEVLNKIDAAIGMEVGQMANISASLADDISMGIIEDKGHNLHVGDKSRKENNDCEIGLIGPHLKSDLLNIKNELPQEDSKWAKPGKGSFQLGPTVNKTQKKGTLSRKPKTTKGTDTENIPHNSVN